MAKETQVSEKNKKEPSYEQTIEIWKNHLNHEYQEQVAYRPDIKGRAKVMVHNWLVMDDEFRGDATSVLGMRGLPLGQLGQGYGKKDTGKSSFLQQAIVQCQKQKIIPVLILSEHKFDFKRLEEWLGGKAKDLIVIETDNLEGGFTHMEKILRGLRHGKLVIPSSEKGGEDIVMNVGNQKVFLFWDSIGGTDTAKILDDDIGDWDKDMGRSAQAYKKMVKRIYQLLHKVKDQAGIFFLNQVWIKRSFSGIQTEQPYGGEAVQHYFAYEIHFKRGVEIKMTHNKSEYGIGYEIKIEIKKNHITHVRPKSSLAVTAAGIIGKDEIGDFKKELKTYMKG